MPEATLMERQVIRKVAIRIMPFVTIGYFLASLDRVNVGFAALQMNKDIGLSAAAFGFGAGLFFVAYCLFAVPCNMLMVRIGARRWLSFVMVAWGVISAAMAFVAGPNSFYALRFLLGIAEAGFFPGVIYLLTLWFPTHHRSRMVAILMMALPVSSVLGSPLSAALLLTDGWLGLRGWHWLFIIEGFPAVLMGIGCALVLPRSIRSARFLNDAQKTWLETDIAGKRQEDTIAGSLSFWQVMGNKYVLLLTLIYIGGTSVTNALSLWQPQIIKAYNLTTMEVGMLNSIPFAIASVAMYLWASHSDRTGERTLHTALPLGVATLGLICTMLVHSLVPMIVVLCVVIASASMIKGPFWALATEMLPVSISALAIGQINSLNNLGVFGATYAIGAIRDATGSFTFAMLPFVAVCGIAGLVALWVGRARKNGALAVMPGIQSVGTAD
jgi:ACS family tartrate transporter-like MFS transporter